MRETDTQARPMRGSLGPQPEPERSFSRSWSEKVGSGVARVALGLAVVVGAFWTGGFGQEPLAALTALGVIAWLGVVPFRPVRRVVNPFAWLWWAMGVWSLIAVIPLPRGIVAALHANAVAISDASRAALDLPVLDFLPIAVAPAEAAFQASLYLTAASLSLIAGLALSDHDIGPLITRSRRWLAVLPLVLAGIWHLAWANWSGPFIPLDARLQLRHFTFVNPNHVASLLTMGLALSATSLVSVRSVLDQRVMSGLVLAHVIALALTPSRAGLLGMIFVGAATVIRRPMRRKSTRIEKHILQSERRRDFILKIVVAVTATAVVALPTIEAEFGKMAIVGRKDPKLSMFFEVLPHLDDGLLLGQGAGTLPVVLLQQDPQTKVRQDFAENIVLDRIVAQGAPFALFFLVSLLWLLLRPMWLWPRRGEAAVFAMAMVAVALHEVVDFSLEMAGALVPFLLVGALMDRARAGSWIERSWTTSLGSRPATLLGSAIGLVLGGSLLVGSWDHRVFELEGTMERLGAEEATHVVATRFGHSHHAFYRLGRIRMDAGDNEGAWKALTRAIELRPSSTHARLFRTAVGLRLGRDTPDDIPILLADPELSQRTAGLLLTSPDGTRQAIAASVKNPDLAWEFGYKASQVNPAALQPLTAALREAYPGKYSAVEQLLAQEYLRIGLYEPAQIIAGLLLGQPETESRGWYVMAMLSRWRGDHNRAHVLFAHVCAHYRDVMPDSCLAAMDEALQRGRPKEAIAYIRAQFKNIGAYGKTLSGYWSRLGLALYSDGRYDDALSAGRRSLSYDRTNLDAQRVIAKAALRMGNWRLAELTMEPIRELGGSTQEITDLANEISETRGPWRAGD